ncbi:WxL domain-containing protein [Lysinibacillus xylanilyticus]|uniref:WxL domain-containing protein n=1 Tax=Lysinibacillus xylanilyticus TaxID=582475 RepID=UPI0036DD22D2
MDPAQGTGGPLSIDFASSLDFGINPISNKEKTYYANAQELRSGENSKYAELCANLKSSRIKWRMDINR